MNPSPLSDHTRGQSLADTRIHLPGWLSDKDPLNELSVSRSIQLEGRRPQA